MKFKYNYLANNLAYQEHELWYEITETFAGNFNSQGFQLTDGWITFTVYANKIRAFYKQMEFTDPLAKPSEVAYYRKDLPKQAEIIFTFTNQDQVEKVAGKWIKKGDYE